MSADDGRSPEDLSSRERLLEAAIELFSERGYAASGVDALSKRAGVAKTVLYWEFKSKAGLLSAVVDRVVAEWVDAITAAASVDAPARARLDAALNAIHARLVERPELLRIVMVVMTERSRIDEEASGALRHIFTLAHTALVDGIAKGTGIPLPRAELELLVETVMAMILGLFIRLEVFGRDARHDIVFAGIRSAVLLLIRELIARSMGRTMLSANSGDLARLLESLPELQVEQLGAVHGPVHSDVSRSGADQPDAGAAAPDSAVDSSRD